MAEAAKKKSENVEKQENAHMTTLQVLKTRKMWDHEAKADAEQKSYSLEDNFDTSCRRMGEGRGKCKERDKQ